MPHEGPGSEPDTTTRLPCPICHLANPSPDILAVLLDSAISGTCCSYCPKGETEDGYQVFTYGIPGLLVHH